MHRRVFTVLLIATLLIGSVFAGGGKESAASSADDNKLVVAIQTHSMVSDYDDNYLTKYIEDLTGIDIEFYELPPAKADVRTNVSLLAASSDDLPDVLLTDALTPETILSYGESGVFVPLDDYVDDAELLPNFNAIPEEDRSVMLETMTMANGHMYSFVRFEPEIWNYTPYRTFINGAWLDKLGLEVPTTTDELKEVLIAFRDNDPNGNGIQDELGVYGYQGKYGQNTIASIMNAFVYYNDQIFNYGLDLAPDGETVYAPFTSDGWREGLKYMNDLYNEGVLAPSIFTDADSQFKARLNETDNVVGLVSAGSLSNWPDAANNKNFLEMELIPPLTGPEGISYTMYNLFRPSQIAFIFNGTDKIELALKFIDAFYASDTSIIARYGEENVDWTRDPEFMKTQSNAYVEAGIYDNVYVADITQSWYTIGNRNWHAVNPRYVNEYQVNSTSVADKPYDPEDPTQLYAKNYEWYVPRHPENILPPLYYTVNEVEEIQEAIINIPPYVTQTLAEFVTGARDPNSDADWNQYLAELENMGLSRWLEIAQDAYERTL